MKIAFLDRDGTINKEFEDEQWGTIEEPVLNEGAVEAMQEMQKRGYEIIIVTNQPLINKGIITQKQYDSYTEKLLNILNINGIKVLEIYFCPHREEENCSCRKPNTGMIEKAIEKYKNIEIEKSFMVGDSLNDVGLGNKMKLKSFGINLKSVEFDFTEVNSLKDVIKYID